MLDLYDPVGGFTFLGSISRAMIEAAEGPPTATIAITAATNVLQIDAMAAMTRPAIPIERANI